MKDLYFKKKHIYFQTLEKSKFLYFEIILKLYLIYINRMAIIIL